MASLQPSTQWTVYGVMAGDVVKIERLVDMVASRESIEKDLSTRVGVTR